MAEQFPLIVQCKEIPNVDIEKYRNIIDKIRIETVSKYVENLPIPSLDDLVSHVKFIDCVFDTAKNIAEKYAEIELINLNITKKLKDTIDESNRNEVEVEYDADTYDLRALRVAIVSESQEVDESHVVSLIEHGHVFNSFRFVGEAPAFWSVKYVTHFGKHRTFSADDLSKDDDGFLYFTDAVYIDATIISSVKDMLFIIGDEKFTVEKRYILFTD